MTLELIYVMCSDSLLYYYFLDEFGSENLPLPCHRDDLEIKLSSYVSYSATTQTFKNIGDGLFTNAMIPVGANIVYFCGNMENKTEYDRQSALDTSLYGVLVKKDCFYVCSAETCVATKSNDPTNLFNKSDTSLKAVANARLVLNRNKMVPDYCRCRLIATRIISSGEEILWEYGDLFEFES